MEGFDLVDGKYVRSFPNSRIIIEVEGDVCTLFEVDIDGTTVLATHPIEMDDLDSVVISCEENE